MIDIKSSNTNSKLGPKTLPISLVMQRTAGELERINLLIRELEDGFLGRPDAGNNILCTSTLQNIDLAQQSVNGLIYFLHNLAGNCDEIIVTVDRSIAQIQLEDMRRRLGENP
jgi:hypothetical protein